MRTRWGTRFVSYDQRSKFEVHYCDFIMDSMAYQITSLTFVCSNVYSDADQRKHQSSASLAFVWGIHRGPVNSPHKEPVTRKVFPFDDVIMRCVATIVSLRLRSSQTELSWGCKLTDGNGWAVYFCWKLGDGSVSYKFWYEFCHSILATESNGHSP